VDTLGSMSQREESCEIYQVRDLVGDIDNLDSFANYIETLKKL
jgi:hypothetical protein